MQKRPGLRLNELFFPCEGPAVLALDLLAVYHRVPAQVARLGAELMRFVEPWRPAPNHPFALSRRRRVAGADDATALTLDRGPVPSRDKEILRLGKVWKLIEKFAVVRPALPLLLRCASRLYRVNISLSR